MNHYRSTRAVLVFVLLTVSFQNCGRGVDTQAPSLQQSSYYNPSPTPGPTATPRSTATPITSTLALSSLEGPVGTVLTVLSTNFNLSTIQTANVNGATALVVASTPTSATLMVMPGSTSGKISIVTSAGTLSSTTNFSVTARRMIANQQGPKLVGDTTTLMNANGLIDVSSAISADGNTAMIGRGNDGATGGAWIFVRNGTNWTQQGPKLFGTDGIGAKQGSSVALSADGNIAILSGWGGGAAARGVWIFKRTNGVWAQLGNKISNVEAYSVDLSADGKTAIVGKGAANGSVVSVAQIFELQSATWTLTGDLFNNGEGPFPATAGGPTSAALSADGKTAVVGFYLAGGSDLGAVWVYSKSGTLWPAQGTKLVASDLVNLSPSGLPWGSSLGWSVDINADGTTVVAGAKNDDRNKGAAVVFVKGANGTWSQQGPKLVGSGAVGPSSQGVGVSISADGNSLVSGGNNDNGSVGALWTFVRNGNAWAQSGPKFVGVGAVGLAGLGQSPGLSSDGQTMLGLGRSDNGVGAAWVFGP